MGRGDRKTRKGKIAIRSYGNVRPHAGGSTAAAKSGTSAPAKSAAKPAAKPAAKKVTVAKKAAAKKPAA